MKRPAKASPEALLRRRAFYLRLPRETLRAAMSRHSAPLTSPESPTRAREGNEPRGQPEFVERSVKGRDPYVVRTPKTLRIQHLPPLIDAAVVKQRSGKTRQHAPPWHVKSVRLSPRLGMPNSWGV